MTCMTQVGLGDPNPTSVTYNIRELHSQALWGKMWIAMLYRGRKGSIFLSQNRNKGGFLPQCEASCPVINTYGAPQLDKQGSFMAVLAQENSQQGKAEACPPPPCHTCEPNIAPQHVGMQVTCNMLGQGTSNMTRITCVV